MRSVVHSVGVDPIAEWLRGDVGVVGRGRADGGSEGEGERTQVRAAEYVRMSTDHQRYSTENQSDAIHEYARRRGIEIVRTYADHGKSGLSVAGRDALQQLLDDVRTGRADFMTILVYDVSRWGRFQDADESAYYEYVCKRAGITVQYCAEQFENDGSPISTIVKGVKRAMAGEYSRELSAKVFAGQCRLIEFGFRQGGPAGYGLRRCLVDGAGAPKGELSRGEQKSIHTDRVVLVHGPGEEIETVRWMYRAFVEQDQTERGIADLLNARGLRTDLGRPWTRGTVHQVLINEKYAGDNVWNRVSSKLHGKPVRNGPDLWIRRDGAFEPVVESLLFNAAQAVIRERYQRLSDGEMLEALRRLLGRHGYLSGILIDEAEDMPSSGAYQSRFGGLLRAYQLVGFTPDRDFRYLEVNRALRAMHPTVVAATVEGIRRAGGEVEQDPASDLLTINGEFTASIVLARCQETASGRLRWHIRLDVGLAPDITVAVRMAVGNRESLDYYLLPRLDVSFPRFRLEEHNGITFDAYRFDGLDALFDLAARSPVLEAAA
jgi:DNA invertase Pin-like site-specific DNA recombinase